MMDYTFENITVETCGGGCHMFYGNLSDGNWFYVTDAWDYGFITNIDLSEYIYNDNFYELCARHAIKELDGNEYEVFSREVIEFVAINRPEFKGYYGD